MNDLIKVGFCVAYDWHMLSHALPLVYSNADSIFLSVDKDRKSWAGKPFAWDGEAFRELIDSLDTHNKITLIEEDFHLQDLTPMENEVRQRNIMAERMGAGGWHIQLDSDEYFMNFGDFVKYLKGLSVDDRRMVNICCSLVTLFKQTEEGFLYVSPERKSSLEFIQVATRHPVYMYGRRNGHFNIYTNYKIIHQSWARSEAEILQKLNNWGHRDDFETRRFFDFWKTLTTENYKKVRDFHPTRPATWRKLMLVKAKNMAELVRGFDFEHYLMLSPMDLFFKNSRVFAKLRQLRNQIK